MVPPTFDPSERATLAALADVLIPAGEDFPSASQAGVAGAGLDRVLSFRPDLAAGLKALLAAARGKAPEGFVATMRREDPAGFGLLAELVPGAYFLDESVRERLGYRGQTPKPIDPAPDPLDAELLRSVVARGPLYRPTPKAPPIRVES